MRNFWATGAPGNVVEVEFLAKGEFAVGGATNFDSVELEVGGVSVVGAIVSETLLRFPAPDPLPSAGTYDDFSIYATLNGDRQLLHSPGHNKLPEQIKVLA